MDTDLEYGAGTSTTDEDEKNNLMNVEINSTSADTKRTTSVDNDVLKISKSHARIAIILVICVLLFIFLRDACPAIDINDIPTNKANSGVSGIVFKGNKIRTYPDSSLKQLLSTATLSSFTWQDPAFTTAFKSTDTPPCTVWGVVTTIHAPTKSMELATKQPGICLVIVADKKTPTEGYVKFQEDVIKNNAATKQNIFVKFLTVEDQDEILQSGLDIMKEIPWNHFGRKNVGFLYAIMNGASAVFDFDDDNELIEGKSLPLLDVKNDVSLPWLVADTRPVFNPYPTFVELDDVAWPRGFPLTQIENKSTWSSINNMKSISVRSSKIGVIQSLANHDPDMDAIWRLTRKLPLNFKDGISVLLSPGTFSSYNAQATLHYALWGMLLPVSIHGRVSDIWRSYIMQRLMHDVGQSVGFVSPFVVQIRNAHNYQGDFMSEEPLYEKTEALVKVLGEWKSHSNIFEKRMIELFIELYERDFIGVKDVTLCQKWINSLKQIGYVFPKLL